MAKIIYDYEMIYDNIRSGKYRNKLSYPDTRKRDYTYITDENQTVKWNRNEVDKYNDSIDSKIKQYLDEDHNLQEMFRSHCVSYISSELSGRCLNENFADIIFTKANDNGHSEGYYSVLQFCYEYINLILSITSKQ